MYIGELRRARRRVQEITVRAHIHTHRIYLMLPRARGPVSGAPAAAHANTARRRLRHMRDPHSSTQRTPCPAMPVPSSLHPFIPSLRPFASLRAVAQATEPCGRSVSVCLTMAEFHTLGRVQAQALQEAFHLRGVGRGDDQLKGRAGCKCVVATAIIFEGHVDLDVVIK